MKIQDVVFENFISMVPLKQTVLDVGCGKGMLSVKLHNAGYKVLCLDKKIQCEKVTGIEYYESDLSYPMPFNESAIDNIVFTEVFEHLKQPYYVIHEFSRIMKNGGRLFMSIPNYWNIKHRLRYLLSGSISTPLKCTAENFTRFINNDCGHINTLSWPMLKFAILAEGFKILMLKTDNHYDFFRRLDYIPWYILIKLYDIILSKENKNIMCLQVTASKDILINGSRVLIICSKNSKEL